MEKDVYVIKMKFGGEIELNIHQATLDTAFALSQFLEANGQYWSQRNQHGIRFKQGHDKINLFFGAVKGGEEEDASDTEKRQDV